MQRRQILPGEAVFFQTSHLVVLDQHVGLQCKLTYQSTSVFGGEVDGH